MLTPALLARCWPRCPAELVGPLARELSVAMERTGINTVARAAVFLGQCGFECNEAQALVEDEDRARAYEGRKDLGNLHPGDGVAYRGRGLIHLTGRSNYRRAGLAIAHDLESHPHRVAEDLGIAAEVAAWYWDTHGLNDLVDAGELRAVTARINGRATDGPPSYHEKREQRILRCAMVLGAAARLDGVDAALALGSPVPDREPEGGGSIRA